MKVILGKLLLFIGLLSILVSASFFINEKTFNAIDAETPSLLQAEQHENSDSCDLITVAEYLPDYTPPLTIKRPMHVSAYQEPAPLPNLRPPNT